MDNQFKYDVKDRYTIETRGSILVCVGHTSWNDGPYKLELRKWVVRGDEVLPQKGITVSHKGADNLTESLVKMGYGNTEKIMALLSERDDYNRESAITEESSNEETDMYTAGDLLKSISK